MRCQVIEEPIEPQRAASSKWGIRVIAVVMAVVAVSCAPIAAESPEPNLSASERVNIVETWYDTRDYTMLADRLDWRHAPGFFGGEALSTPSDVEEKLAPFYFEVFDNIEVDIERIEASDASVFSFGVYILTPKNSDQLVRAPFIHVWTVDSEGKLSGMIQYADTLLISQALHNGRVLRQQRN